MSYELVDGKVVSPEGCELNVAHHCNLGCASCSHLSPVFRRSLIATETAARDLSLLARSFRARFVKVLGGEPLLHPELVPLLGLVRDCGIAPHTTVCTNGLLLPRMRDDFWAAVDEVEISVYPGRELPREKMAGVRAYADKHGVRLTLAYYSHFRYSYAERGTEDDRLVRHIYDTCQIAHVWRCHTLYEGHFFKCPQSVFLPQVLEGAGDPMADGLRLSDAPDFPERLLAYLRSPEPLRACRNCLGSAGLRMPHQQRSRRDFRELQDHSSEELTDRQFLKLLDERPDADDGCAVEDRDAWRERLAGQPPAAVAASAHPGAGRSTPSDAPGRRAHSARHAQEKRF
ncbi:radical SAM protein [Streptomyces sp. NPDC059631]|uniref:radical SAM protein n=1 Tax=unclassified Streptomyces TaxID=2593676 RepID=UPI003679731A